MDILTYIQRMNQLYGNEQQVASLPFGTPESYGPPEELSPMPNIQDIIREEGIPVGPQVNKDGGRIYDTRKYLQGGRVGLKPGGIVEPGVVHYGTEDIKFGSGTDTSAMDNPKYYKTVRAELNKIKKQRHKVEFFDWKEGDDWYKALSKRLGGMNREHMNKLLNKVVAEEFPLAYAGRAGREAYKNDTVVRAFLGHLETVGEFDGNEKMAKILQQFQSAHPDHKFETINKTFRKWANGDFEVRGVDRSKLTKADLDAIKNWKPQMTGNRTLMRENQLKYLHTLNDTLGDRNLKTIQSMFKKKFPNAPENAFWHRVDQLNQLKRTGKVISGLNTPKSYKWNSVGERSNWLKEGFGAQFQGNYTKLTNKADKLAAQGNRQGANRLYAAGDKFFGPDGIFTKAGGQGEHPLSRLMGGVDQQLKINSLVRGDLNQWKRLNFDDPVMKLMNDYAKTKPGSLERTKIINEIENRKKLMNILTESPNEKGIVESVKFNYGDKRIGPSSSVVPIDQVKDFNVEDYTRRGTNYLTEFTKKGKKLDLLTEVGTIGAKALDAKQVNQMLQDSGFDISDCLSQGGRVGLALGTTPNRCISKVVNNELKLANKTGNAAKFSKFGKLARGAGYLFGWADIPLELGFALPSLLAGDVEGAKRATTAGLVGWGGKRLDQIDQEKNPEAYKYFKHVQDVNDWMDAFNQQQNAQSELGKFSEDWVNYYEKHGDKSGYTDRVVNRYQEAVDKQDEIAKNYIGYTDELGQEDLQALDVGREEGKKYLTETVKEGWKEGMDLDLFLPPSARVAKDVLGLETKKVAPFKPDEITSLEQQIEQKGDPYYGKWWKRGTRHAAEELGDEDLHTDWYDRFYGRDPREAYSDLPLEWASQLGPLEKKEWAEDPRTVQPSALEEWIWNKKHGYAGGGRVPFGKGQLVDKGRRAFMKLLAALGIGTIGAKSGISLFGKVAGKGKTVIKAGDHIIQGTKGMPDWYIPLVNRVVKEGDDVTAKLGTIEREIVHTKKIGKGEEVTVYQDMNTGNVRVEYHSSDIMGEGIGPVSLEYRAPQVIDESKYAGQKTKSEFSAAEPEPVSYTQGPDDQVVEWDGVAEYGRTEDLMSDTSKLKQFATKKKPTMKEIVESSKKKKAVQKVHENESDYIVSRQGEGEWDDYLPDLDDMDY